MPPRPVLTTSALELLCEEIPSDIYHCRGQLSFYDRLIYYWAARFYYRGFGTIVDAGALIGGSAKLFGHGLSKNPDAGDARKRILSFDQFEDDAEGYRTLNIRAFPGVTMPEPVNGKIDFEPIFRWNTSDYAHMIDVRRGDIAVIGYEHDLPIEILSLDVAKSPALMLAIANDFFTRLVPERSLVLNQDYIFPHQPWIPIAMELLADCFETVYEPPSETTLVQILVRPITRDLVRERLGVTGRDFFRLENVGLLASAGAKLKHRMNQCALRLAQCYAYSECGRARTAQNVALSVLREYNLAPETIDLNSSIKRIYTDLKLPYR